MQAKSDQAVAYRSSGFTLIELMIVVAIVAILSAIAIPNYTDFLLRGKIVEATNSLSSVRASMEQYYQDNRTYLNVGTTIISPCNSLPTLKYFALTCQPLTATTYTIRAAGVAATSTANFSYSVTNANVQSSSTGAVWGSTTGTTCWLMKKGATC
ncbi:MULTISPECIES: type IV pilin protein [unclassified Undibacterium]|uniref:type IV pilin protein n=1 Tax=unclassified Undibacterium TaxID=2630295 RepID=UPI002AC8A060|nr:MULTISPECIES: type IV pilin protein [unclassified Undibacterium]MEB0139491.1 type IV pilin protein [Undibacterium sp. CCC2.1]MEB0172400.1 type IV pilin protein [Undibacterium sp. CCC1.1]MEB0175727.1 type IV pilin protein [Undibacterium sp. CCC3.4]MEB0214515.1 type IV pilin protein [Undibacterium sp. 5I2]WPX42910.1 type IV pilin protein [Undibacterium sp. CCC3.4]